MFVSKQFKNKRVMLIAQPVMLALAVSLVQPPQIEIILIYAIVMMDFTIVRILFVKVINLHLIFHFDKK